MSDILPLHPLQYRSLLEAALAEDLGGAGDLTSNAILPPRARANASVATREPGVLAGLGVAAEVFRLVDPEVGFVLEGADGQTAAAGSIVARVEGSARSVLTAERTALNLLGRLSGIATATRAVVEAVEGTSARVVCTRKTTPGLRALEKYAVRCGGGANHRFGLHDAVLIKDNHLAVAGSVAEAVRRVRSVVGHLVAIEVEVDTLEQLREALEQEVDAVLLDNMPPDVLRQAVRITAGRAITEASGRITPETARAVAETGVDLLSIGWLTHSARSLDVGLDVET